MMKAKIFMVVMLMSFSAILVAQPDAVVAKKQMLHERMARMNERKGPGNGERKGPNNGLNLTDAQKATFKAGMLDVQKQLQPLRNQLGEARAHQKSLVTAEKSDLAAINKNLEKMGDLRIQMAKIQMKHLLDMRAQLTDEQRLKFDLFKHQMKQNMGQRKMKMMKHRRMM
jgi:Spy/CpxP family protein refolding chaperone